MPVTLPPEVLQRVARVLDYHQASKLADGAPPLTSNLPKPSHRTFESDVRVALPTRLLDASPGVLEILHSGLSAVPESQLRPPQDLQTLASWLYYGAGLTEELGPDRRPLRVCPTDADHDPCEIYVAAFRIAGLEPGLYHFSTGEFALRKLRDGALALRHLKRGRPDMNILNDLPGALIVSSVCCRSAWRFGRRAYRAEAVEVGRAVQNLVTAAAGLGIQTVPRLRVADAAMRELIGLPPQPEFCDLEHVHAMIFWADPASPDVPAPTLADGELIMPPIPRTPLAESVVSIGSMRTTHDDCVAPGVIVRDIREPHTELSPVIATAESEDFSLSVSHHDKRTVRHTMTHPAVTTDFPRLTLSRDDVVLVSQAAFRTGSFFPLFPAGLHPGLVRPFWVAHDVVGLDSGIWYHNPQTNRWCFMSEGEHRMESQYLALGREAFGNAAAVCWMCANLHKLMPAAGPDLYRLAHLEAGLMQRRIELACAALGLGAIPTCEFLDEEVRRFLNLDRTRWEPIAAIAIGPVGGEAPSGGDDEERLSIWRD